MLSKRKFIKLSTLTAFSGIIPHNALAKKINVFTNLIKKSGFEDNTSFMTVDLRSNKLIGRYNEKLRLPIASVTKMVTACYYLANNFKPERFKTELFTDGINKAMCYTATYTSKVMEIPLLRRMTFRCLLMLLKNWV